MIEQIINSFNVKYSILDVEVEKNIKSGNSIDIYINMESVLGFFYTTVFDGQTPKMEDSEYYSLTPSLINIAAHYRHYFWSRYKVPSRIYYYNTNGISKDSANHVPDYNLIKANQKALSNENYKLVNSFINTNLDLFKDIVEYMHDVYYVDINDIESTTIPYTLMNKNSSRDKINLVISRDLNDMQLLPLVDNTLMLYVASDKSKIIPKEDIIKTILNKSSAKFIPKNDINPNFISTIYAQSGIKSRNIKGIKNFGSVKAIKAIDTGITDGKISNSKIYDPSLLCSLLELKDKDIIINNFKALDLERLGLGLNDIKLTEIEVKSTNNVYNNEAIMYINEHYFKTYEINLLYLEEGVYRV